MLEIRRECFLRPLDWLLRQGIVFPIAQCKGIRISQCRKFFLWKTGWVLGFGIRYVAQGILTIGIRLEPFQLRILNPSSTERESGIQSWITLLGAIPTCVSALGWISCKQRHCISGYKCLWQYYNPEKSLGTIFANVGLFLTSHSQPPS